MIGFSLKATSHLTISMLGQRETGKIQRNNYHHGNCEPSLTDKTLSVSLIFTHGTHRNGCLYTVEEYEIIQQNYQII